MFPQRFHPTPGIFYLVAEAARFRFLFVDQTGVRAKGGSISGHGPAIVGGMLFMGSGYSVGSGASVQPGNVLIAFGVE